tara:strand:- start:898 stop:2835 length:1938 start_codon:yes stop_codon:yes gene_type:complete
LCGIFGIISNKPQNEDYIENIIRRMSLSLLKRGPDNSGSWRDTSLKVFLGHTRLSIIDISDYSNQPIHSNNNRYVMSYNGEIYNFRDLKKKLENEKIYIKNPNSDTNVLLSCFERWGINKTISQINGMFSIALFDKEERKITLIRDRIGIKPLFYCYINNMFVFASELKAFSIFKSDLSLNNNAMNEYLNYGFISSQQTIYKECNRLLPATILELNIDNIHDINITKYWNLYNFINQDKINLNEIEIINETSKKVEQSVKNQMISDVPIGSFLSGGIDSSIVTSLMQKNSIDKINTFSIGSKNKDYDESIDAKKIANFIGTNHTELIFDDNEMTNIIEELPNVYDEPFADPSQIPTLLVSKLARKNVKVTLSGDGGDELFAGYNRHLWLPRMLNLILKHPQKINFLIKILTNLLSTKNYNMLGGIFSKIITNKIPPLLGEKILKISKLIENNNVNDMYENILNFHDNNFELFDKTNYNILSLNKIEKNNLHDLDQLLLLDQSIYLPANILVKLDRASMYNSLEARVPLLDHDLIEFSWRLSSDLKIKNNILKYILKEVSYRNIDKKILLRPKKGFSVPINNYLRSGLKNWAEDLINSKNLKDNQVLNQSNIKKLWERFLNGDDALTSQVWLILTYQNWFEKWKNI